MYFLRKKIFPILAAALLSNSVNAAGVNIALTDVAFNNVTGNTTGFTWSLDAGADQIVNLSALYDYQTVTYATFTTSAFPINYTEHHDNGDYFESTFDLTPPGQIVSATGAADADCGLAQFFCLGQDSVWVNFNNEYQFIDFGLDGMYAYRFFDSATLTGNGTVDLEVEFVLLSEDSGASTPTNGSTAPSPVPVPPALLLMGSGLFGLASFARRRKVIV